MIKDTVQTVWKNARAGDMIDLADPRKYFPTVASVTPSCDGGSVLAVFTDGTRSAVTVSTPVRIIVDGSWIKE